MQQDTPAPARSYGESQIADLLRKGNLAQAEILLRLVLEREPTNALALNFLGLIAHAVNLPHFAIQYFNEASRLAPRWEAPRQCLKKVNQQLSGYVSRKGGCDAQTGDGLEIKHVKQMDKFLLIKAWGLGFWSDVSHVLGQSLIAEITGRIPVVHWGTNSLFGDDTGSNAFEFYFEPLSAVAIDDLKREDFDFWPSKWNHSNLEEGEINKWTGPYSRVAGLYLLGRSERVVVSDFYTGVIDLRPWIPPDHHLYGLSIDELCSYLVRRYLRPRQEILDEVDEFYRRHLVSSDFISVHARGSDKAMEMQDLAAVNRQYHEIIRRRLTAEGDCRLFLMTDDSRVLNHFVDLYGNRVVTTNCQRTNNEEGIHYQPVPNRRRLGMEVMVDVYLAAKGRAFVGNGFSNPSLVVRYLKDWVEGDVSLIGRNMYHTYNTVLHHR